MLQNFNLYKYVEDSGGSCKTRKHFAITEKNVMVYTHTELNHSGHSQLRGQVMLPLNKARNLYSDLKDEGFSKTVLEIV